MPFSRMIIATINVKGVRGRLIARALSDFQAASPDCNAEGMQRELMAFLREAVEADGVLDEREELAVDAITAAFKQQREASLQKLSQSVAGLGAQTSSAVSELRRRVGKPKPKPGAGLTKPG